MLMLIGQHRPVFLSFNENYHRICGVAHEPKKFVSRCRGKWDDMGLARTVGPQVQGKVAKGTPAAPSLGGAFAKLPLLSGWLTETAWEDGEGRTPGSLILFAQDGRWKAMLSDKDNDYIAFVCANDFAGLLGALEKGLEKGDLDWREPRGGTAKPKKKD